MNGEVVSVSISKKKGVQKTPVDSVNVIVEHGLEGDAHAGKWHRQVSLLASEGIKKMVEKGLKLSSGDFGENITTKGIVLNKLPIGTVLKIGESVVLEVTQIGKKCHTKCNIYYQAGDCIMPNEGIFAKVIETGSIKSGDNIEVITHTK